VAFGGDLASAAVADRRAVEAMATAPAGSDRPLVLASGMLGLSNGRVAPEDDGVVRSAEARANPAGRRAGTAVLTLSLAGTGVCSCVLRLPPMAHGDGDNGLVATLVRVARQRQVAAHKRLTTDGRPLPGVELRLDHDGQILSCGPQLLIGYANLALLAGARDGWYHTGDVGVTTTAT